jgi:short-subunit dehydrogenase
MKAPKNEVVVITGASAGVGRATVREFAGNGAKVALLARGHLGLEAARKEVLEAGSEALAITVDMSDPNQVEAAAEKIEQELGPIDIWVNCAMTTVFSEFMNIRPEEFKRVTEVTYLGYVYGTMAALKRMTGRNSGTIVQVGSAIAYRSIPLQSAYCGAKHAILGFTNSIRSELFHQKSKVWITMVQMPALNTPQFDWCRNYMPRKSQPVPPIYQPEVAADAVYWAAHKRRREVVVGESSFIVIWGNKFLPGLGDWYLSKTGYKSQMYDGPEEANRPYNLWSPVEGDFGARGSFTSKAKNHSFELKLTKLPGYPFYGGIISFTLLLWLIKRTIMSYRCKNFHGYCES